MSSDDRVLTGEVQGHYDRGLEDGRLASGVGALEFARAQEIVLRHLHRDASVVLDVGGGTGPYARWLAGLGHEVHLIDAVEGHVEEARTVSGPRLAGIEVGDARSLAFEDASADLVLLFGPLYHLTERPDRVLALCEARRVLRPGGVVLAACISRFASALDGLASKHLDERDFAAIVERDLAEGQHRNPTDHPAWFTTAYFHTPDEIRGELEEAGLTWEQTLGIEGPTWIMRDFEAHWDDPARRERLLGVLRRLEEEPSLLGASAHLIGIGRRQ